MESLFSGDSNMNPTITIFNCALLNPSSSSLIMKVRVDKDLVTFSIRNSLQCSVTFHSDNQFRVNPTLHDQLDL